MMKNKLATLIPAALLAMSLAACGTPTTNAPAESPAAEATVIEQEAEQTPAAETTVEEAAAEEEAVKYTNKDMVLSVPAKYNDLLIVDVPENDENGILFKVYEKASVEAAKAQGDDVDGPGWLFDIGTEDEAVVQKKFCDDMSGENVFAQKEDGTYFVQYHPTDVRFVREQYDDIDEDMAQWSELNEWAATVPGTFVEENAGLTLEKHSNTSLDIYFARIKYDSFVNYTLASLEHGVWGPAEVDPAPHLEKLDGITFEYADDVEAPDGEYVVLGIPDDNVRFDFFFAPDGQNYVREALEIEGESYEYLYKANVPEGSPTLNEIMNEWYLDVVNNGGEAIDAH